MPAFARALPTYCDDQTKGIRRSNILGPRGRQFWPARAKLLIVGLAPGAHGANRTGRMFTGDRSGDWLYRALHRGGFASQPESTDRDDGLKLKHCVITAICHCAPPDNKPTAEERANCRSWLTQTIKATRPTAYLALGRIAWDGVWPELCEQYDFQTKRPKFSHGAEQTLPNGRLLIGCYHPSQQNTFTGRLTESMLDAVIRRIRDHLKLDA